MNAPASDHGRWRKSSYSGPHANCVECAPLSSSFVVRDSKDPGGGHLVFAAPEWAAFLLAVKRAGL
ncbi:DUF397 domain-containing protein [Actinorugispora endophytica]|uniref:Uncharacterized protein DUF397 n=1 Tax=Actinorugispora endophytica TaxID=1605990 RepID=A0A4V3D983_9ACTN|nr:DUF397 domain-containing protein [Actinorugispora endophytica]TDQ55110.1 uncharacterized protein DUF397 [Actinorugispora endophytica]